MMKKDDNIEAQFCKRVFEAITEPVPSYRYDYRSTWKSKVVFVVCCTLALIFTMLFNLLAVAPTASARGTDVGKLPKLGYDTFNAFGCDYNSSLVLKQAQAMKEHGLVGLGYNMVILDDCYALRERNIKGEMVADPKKFPDGMPYFSGQLSQYGIQLAAYGDNGYATCAGYPGSYGHEKQDLKTWQEWGMSYLKYDNCYIPADNITQQNLYGRYSCMSSAIAELAAETGNPPFEFALCEWGWGMVPIWGSKLAQAWRITADIKPFWYSIESIISQASYSWWGTNFYGHNDLDIMEVGNTGVGTPPGNLTYEESKTHFTAWALLKSPLIIGTDLTIATSQTLSILKNHDLIRINQDPNVGESVYPFRGPGNIEYWTGNSTWGVVFMIINSQDTTQDMFFNLTESWAIRVGRKYTVYDLWSHTHNGTLVRNMTVTLPPHGVAALLVNDAGPDGIEGSCALYWQCSWPNLTYISN